ncbi:ABC transporter permease [Jiangella asiatica]|uniref:ABC transporter permease n=1 Tax=Jiangella asiatica TaxID=2530372 RepID=A0A4R5DIK7_9ACTN|nr:ABC transporter permease [Jiangella asiatica]TDE10605.1 ABC transporter permease [Jiangella asiatica]
MTAIQPGQQIKVTAHASIQDATATRSWLRGAMVAWLVGAAGGLLLILVVLPAIITTSPTEINAEDALARPSLEHLFGTDQLGRDVLARVVHGARLSLAVSASSTLIAVVLASILGALAATGRPWVQEIVMRFVDIGLAFPGILLPLVLAAVMGPSMATTIIALGVLFTFPMTRVVRGAIFAEYAHDYVLAARLLGTGRVRLVGYHIGLNAALPILVYATLIMAGAILAEAALSFLGAGVPPPAPSWGNIIRDGFSIVHAGAWWVSLFPGLAIVLTVLGLNRFSESLGRQLRMR